MSRPDRLPGRGRATDRDDEVEVEPVMLRRGGSVDAVGESHYQAALAMICGGKTEAGHQRLCMATLVPEPGNPHDPNAVAVHVDRLKVAYLSRRDAVAYRHVLARLTSQGLIGACVAVIVGGWDRGAGDEGHFGIRLDLAPPQWAHPHDPEPAPVALRSPDRPGT